MPLLRAPVATGLVLAVLLALSACAAGPGGSAPSTSPPAGDGGIDACALVPAAQLRAAVGADPGEGVAAAGEVDGGQCTWRVSDAHTVLAQATRQPDAYLPASAWPRPTSGAAVPGADRGWASAARHTILVVKDGRGLLLTDVGLTRAHQADYDALAAAIVARLRLGP